MVGGWVGRVVGYCKGKVPGCVKLMSYGSVDVSDCMACERELSES